MNGLANIHTTTIPMGVSNMGGNAQWIEAGRWLDSAADILELKAADLRLAANRTRWLRDDDAEMQAARTIGDLPADIRIWSYDYEPCAQCGVPYQSADHNHGDAG